MDSRLEEAINLLLESERAGVLALEELARDATSDKLRTFLRGAREEEARNVRELEALIRTAGGTPSDKTGPFAAKVAALTSIRDRLELMARGQEWVARKTEDALQLAPPAGPIREFLTAMANHHRAEVEWGRAEVIRMLSA